MVNTYKNISWIYFGAFSQFSARKQWMDKNDVDITVDVELLREEFYRIKNQRHFYLQEEENYWIVTAHTQKHI